MIYIVSRQRIVLGSPFFTVSHYIGIFTLSNSRPFVYFIREFLLLIIGRNHAHISLAMAGFEAVYLVNIVMIRGKSWVSQKVLKPLLISFEARGLRSLHSIVQNINNLFSMALYLWGELLFLLWFD
jgi:hypothetical protein